MEAIKQETAGLKVLPLSYLWDGLVLEDDVYNADGNVLLLPHGDAITEKRLLQLKNFGTEDACVSMREASYQVVLQGARERLDQREREIGYTPARTELERVISRGRARCTIRRQDTEATMKKMIDMISGEKLTEVLSCLDTVRPVDELLQRHLINVGVLNGVIGEWMGLPEKEVELLVLTGLLHDVGKTNIPPEILNAPRRLTKEEYEIVKKHPVYSAELIGDEFDVRVREGALYHHERMDGSGYPEGLRQDEIGLFARITAVSDVYDAMVSRRCYKDGVFPLDILGRLADGEFAGLDGKIVHIFAKHMLEQFRKKRVIMSDGHLGTIVYIPQNDIANPVVFAGNCIRQTDTGWHCRSVDFLAQSVG